MRLLVAALAAIVLAGCAGTPNPKMSREPGTATAPTTTAAAPAAEPAAPAEPAPAPGAAPKTTLADAMAAKVASRSERLICREDPGTGTRLTRGKRQCATKEEWAERARADRKALEDASTPGEMPRGN